MNYELIFSNRKTVALEVNREGRVLIRAPKRMPRKDIDAFFDKHRDWLQAQLVRQQAWAAAHPEPTEQEQYALTAKAKSVLPAKVSHYARIMGLKPAGISITGARTRFGSCSPKDRLCFSWRLMQYPEEAIDYVVVHELAHIVHRNHGPAFHALVESILPDHRNRRALLKE
jgi:predicted metal-dependent hydrolase